MFKFSSYYLFPIHLTVYEGCINEVRLCTSKRHALSMFCSGLADHYSLRSQKWTHNGYLFVRYTCCHRIFAGRIICIKFYVKLIIFSIDTTYD